MNTLDHYAVIGHPIAHSRSPEIHTRFAQQTGQPLTYGRLLAPLDGFSATVQEFIREGGKGANVTLPFKQEAMQLATSLTERAQAAGAVNTLIFRAGYDAHCEEIIGDNTDGVGLITDLTQNAAFTLRGKKILLLGAGGAAYGALLPLLAEQPAELLVANRTAAKAVELVRKFAPHAAACKLHTQEFSTLQKPFDLIINASAASLAAQLPPLCPSIFAAHTLAYDMMYSAQPTVFMTFAQQHGAQTRDGLGMLVEQAAESFYLWRKVRPATAPVLQELRAALTQ